MDASFLHLVRDVAILFPAFLIVFSFRGFFKAWMAKIQGDNTAWEAGFVSLNPLAHVDIFGLLLVLGVLFILGGILPGAFSRAMLFIFLIAIGARWTYPVPIVEHNFTHRLRGAILTTLAGPFGNFIVALIFLYVRKYFPFQALSFNLAVPLAQIFSAIVELAIYFGVLDLIPLPPFDGGYLLFLILPESKYQVIGWLEEYSLYILLALFLVPGISDVFFGILFSVASFIEHILTFLVI